MEYDPLDAAAEDPSLAAYGWDPTQSVPAASMGVASMGMPPSMSMPLPSMGANSHSQGMGAPLSMDPYAAPPPLSSEDPSYAQQAAYSTGYSAYQPQPQSLYSQEQNVYGHEGGYDCGATAAAYQQAGFAPPPDVLLGGGGGEAAPAAPQAMPPWAAAGASAPYDAYSMPGAYGMPTMGFDGVSYDAAGGFGQQGPGTQVTHLTGVAESEAGGGAVRSALAAAKQRALEAATGGSDGGSRRSRFRSPSRSRSRSRSRERGRRSRRSRSSSRERYRSRRGSSRDRSERGRRSRHEEADYRSRGYVDEEYEFEGGSYSRRRGRSESRDIQEPTPTIFIKGIPESSTEEDLQILLSPYPNITSVRLVKNKETGMHRGFAFVDFATAEDAARFMDPTARHTLGGNRLYTEFTQPSQFVSSAAAAAQEGAQGRGGSMPADDRPLGKPLDWICDMCQAVNFARRLECFQCSSPRPLEPRRVQLDVDGPSTILKVSGLSEEATEDGLRYIFSVHMPVLDVRLIRDKFTGAPRGFAFVELSNTTDSTRALNQLQNFVPEFQTTPIRLSYARDRTGSQPAQSTAALPLEAVQEMQEMSGWAPKEFNEGAVDAEAPPEQQQQQQSYQQQQEQYQQQLKQYEQQMQQYQQQLQGSSATNNSSEAQAGASTSAPSSQPLGTSGYIYDEASGYYYDPASGSHYDGKTGYFYFPTTQQWCAYDQASNQYIPVSGSAADKGASTAAHAALATTESAVAAQRMSASAPGAQGPPPKSNRPKAVIGAKPQYNSQGLLAAVQQLSEKEAQQKALQNQQQKSSASNKPQVSKPAQVNPNSKAANPTPNPGLGSMNTGAAGKQQAQTQAQQQQQQQQQAAEAAVQGRIYRSKWSQRH